MADSPSAILLLRLMSTGSQTNLWGGYLNVAMQTLERASNGYQALAVTGDATISHSNYSASNDLQVAFAKLTGSLTSAASLTLPGRQINLGVSNTAGQTVTLLNSGGTGVAIPNSRRALLFGDATDINEATPNWISEYASTLSNDGDIVVKYTLEAAIAAASGLTAPFILVSAADTTAGYLGAKIVASGDAEIDTINGGGDEDVQVSVIAGKALSRAMAIT